MRYTLIVRWPDGAEFRRGTTSYEAAQAVLRQVRSRADDPIGVIVSNAPGRLFMICRPRDCGWRLRWHDPIAYGTRGPELLREWESRATTAADGG